MTTTEPPRRRPGGQLDPEADRLILETAKRLMHERGYDRLTIDAVAKHAGVARTTVYRRYKDKAELVSIRLPPGAGFASPPVAVTATPDDGSATVSWDLPLNPGLVVRQIATKPIGRWQQSRSERAPGKRPTET
jgi:hypothetical protein